MSITGLPGQGPVRVGIPVADSDRRPVRRDRHPGRAARAREVRQGPGDRDVAAAGADLHARLPGRALADRAARWPSRPATITRPAIPTGVFKTARRLHQHRRLRPARCGSGFARRSARRALLQTPDYRHGASALEEPRRAQRRDRKPSAKPHQRRMGRALQQGRRAVRADLFDRQGVRRPAGASISASPRTSTAKAKRKLTLVGQPVSLSRTPSHLVAPPPRLGEHTDAVLKEFGFSSKRRRSQGRACD